MLYTPLSIVYDEKGVLSFIRMVNSNKEVEDYALNFCTANKVIKWLNQDMFIFNNAFAVTELQLTKDGSEFITDEFLQFFVEKDSINTGTDSKLLVYNSLGESEEVSPYDLFPELLKGSFLMGNPSIKLCDTTDKLEREEISTKYHALLKHNRHEVLFHPDYSHIVNLMPRARGFHSEGKVQNGARYSPSIGVTDLDFVYEIGEFIFAVVGDVLSNL